MAKHNGESPASDSVDLTNPATSIERADTEVYKPYLGLYDAMDKIAHDHASEFGVEAWEVKKVKCVTVDSRVSYDGKRYEVGFNVGLREGTDLIEETVYISEVLPAADTGSTEGLLAAMKDNLQQKDIRVCFVFVRETDPPVDPANSKYIGRFGDSKKGLVDLLTDGSMSVTEATEFLQALDAQNNYKSRRPFVNETYDEYLRRHGAPDSSTPALSN